MTRDETNHHFWQMLDQLVVGAELVIDRPKGSQHPVWVDVTYPLDYGYLAGTTSADGAGIDVWLGSSHRSDHLKRITGVICTVDALKRDAEIKVLLNCKPDEMQVIRNFHTDETVACKLISRPE